VAPGAGPKAPERLSAAEEEEGPVEAEQRIKGDWAGMGHTQGGTA